MDALNVKIHEMVESRTDPYNPRADTHDQEWDNPQLWSALGSPPDTDNVDGLWIVSHVRGPIEAMVQAMRQGAVLP